MQFNEDDEEECPFFDKYKITGFLGQGAFGQAFGFVDRFARADAGDEILVLFLVRIAILEPAAAPVAAAADGQEIVAVVERRHALGALDHFAHLDQVGEYLLAGAYWTLMVLAFEWVGSLLIRRPIKEILVGWHVERGYMWPYVLLTYLLSPLVVGVLFTPGTSCR